MCVVSKCKLSNFKRRISCLSTVSRCFKNLFRKLKREKMKIVFGRRQPTSLTDQQYTKKRNWLTIADSIKETTYWFDRPRRANSVERVRCAGNFAVSKLEGFSWKLTKFENKFDTRRLRSLELIQRTELDIQHIVLLSRFLRRLTGHPKIKLYILQCGVSPLTQVLRVAAERSQSFLYFVNYVA